MLAALTQTRLALTNPAHLASDVRFTHLGTPRKIFAVGAIMGDAAALAVRHEEIFRFFSPGDRLVYLGNYLGPASETTAALDEILRFRVRLMAKPGIDASDIVFLRGMMEELWRKLLQIQFAQKPHEVLDWMARFGIGHVLSAYGASLQEARVMLRDGPIGLTKWTKKLREAIRNRPGHEALTAALKRAAFTERALFVASGVEPSQALDAQSDQFWWSTPAFEQMGQAYTPFARVVRGHDFYQQGWAERPFALSLDQGAGCGGDVGVAMLTPDGQRYQWP